MGICFSLVDTELKNSSLETIGEDVVGKTSIRRDKHREKGLENAGLVLESAESSLRIMVWGKEI